MVGQFSEEEMEAALAAGLARYMRHKNGLRNLNSEQFMR